MQGYVKRWKAEKPGEVNGTSLGKISDATSASRLAMNKWQIVRQWLQWCGALVCPGLCWWFVWQVDRDAALTRPGGCLALASVSPRPAVKLLIEGDEVTPAWRDAPRLPQRSPWQASPWWGARLRRVDMATHQTKQFSWPMGPLPQKVGKPW